MPSFLQAAAQVMLLLGVPLTRMLPSTASSCSGCAPSAGATASNSFASALTRRLARRGRNAADRGRSAGTAVRRQVVVADHQLHLAHLQAQRFRRHLRDDGAGAGAEILRADLDRAPSRRG